MTEATTTPPPSQLVQPEAMTHEQIRASEEQLRSDRLAGKIRQSDYFERMEYYRAVKAGEQVGTPPFERTPDQRFEAELDAAMAPPKDAAAYGFLDSGLPPGSVLGELDAPLRAAFLAAEVPVGYASTIVTDAGRLLQELEGQPEDACLARCTTADATLRRMWGKDYDSNREKVEGLIQEMAKADKQIRDLLLAAPWVLDASPRIMDLLARTAAHRERRSQAARR